MADKEHHEAITDPFGRLTRRYQASPSGDVAHGMRKAAVAAAVVLVAYSAYRIHSYVPNVYAMGLY